MYVNLLYMYNTNVEKKRKENENWNEELDKFIKTTKRNDKEHEDIEKGFGGHKLFAARRQSFKKVSWKMFDRGVYCCISLIQMDFSETEMES